MKPLSIEELKRLKIGDWVWLTDETGHLGRYVAKTIAPIKEYDKTFNFDSLLGSYTYSYFTYGTIWLAYKNKEQVECKGELVEFVCKVGDIICIPWAYDGEYGMAKYLVKHIDFYGYLAKYRTDFENDIEDKYLLYKCNNGDFNTYNFNEIWFLDEKLAEQKLKELRGNNGFAIK